MTRLKDAGTSIFNGQNPRIYLITTAYGDKLGGVIATWVMAASLVPERKRVVLVLSPHNYTTQLLLKRGTCIIHLLDRQQLDLVPVFGLYSSATTDKFVNTEYALSQQGLPVVAFTCGWALVKLVHHVHDQDRIIITAHVLSEHVNPDTEALTTDHLKQLPADTQDALNRQFKEHADRDRDILNQV